MKSQSLAILPNDWLEYLANHRIFELTSKDAQQASRTFDRANQYDTFAQQYQTRVIVLRGSDLIVAVGSQLRLLDLNAVKDAWIEVAPQFIDAGQASNDWLLDIPYKTLATPSIDFTIESLNVNSKGNLLAVAGQKRLAVVCLPPTGFSHTTTYSSQGQVECKVFVVGRDIYGDKARVLKAEWHPLSETMTHIMVLSTDSVLRMFDVSGSIDESEQTFDLSPTYQRNNARRPSRGIVLDDDLGSEDEAVSFAVGGKSQKGSGWEPFTVYFTLRNGHTYALCPVLPFNSVVHNRHLESLACVVEAKTSRVLEQYKLDQSDGESKALYYLFRLQSQWISDLIASAKTADGDKITVRTTDSCIPFPIQRQGPFRVEGQPTKAGGQNEVSDMLFIRTEAANAIILAFTDGIIETHLLGSAVDPQWLMPNNSNTEWETELGQFLHSTDVLPKATVHEAIDLKIQSSTSIMLVRDPLYSDTFYAYHGAGLHRIALTKLINNIAVLEEAYQTGASHQDFEKAMEEYSAKDSQADVQCLIESSITRINEPLIGATIITDVYLSYSILALTRSYKLTAIELGLRQSQLASSSNTSSKLGSGQAAESQIPNGSLLTESYTVPELTQPKILVPQEFGGKKEVVITEESLLFITKSSEKIYSSIKELNKSRIQAEKRMALQEMEIHRQIEQVQSLCERLEQQQIQDEQHKKILDAAQVHGKLALRIDSVLRKVMGSQLPELSSEEKKWVESLDEIQTLVAGDQGYIKRLEMLQNQVSSLQERAAKIQWRALGGTRKSALTSAQVADLRRLLDKQGSLVQETKERVGALLS
ncbi:hypothetical protein BJV82DRAFT_539839 [Fennellomyces sp. T-0311]|nr:hypothetical protein BJV82DRAFT_539839 [Fennellomyces sp. T-0311]